MKLSRLTVLSIAIAFSALVSTSTALVAHATSKAKVFEGIDRIYPSELSAPRQDVKIYVTSWCGYCQKLESFLKKNGVRYQRFDIERDAKGRSRYTELGRGGVPLAEVNGKIVRGFSESEYRSLLKLR